MSAEPSRRGKGRPPGKLSPEERREEIDRLVSENLGLVYDLARKLDQSGGVGPERGDLVSAGVQGLIQAATAFDPSRGLAFSTLAVTRIRGAMLDELRRWDQTPRSVRRKERQIRATEAELLSELERKPTPEELAGALDIDLEELHGWRFEMKRHVTDSLHESSRGPSDASRPRTVAETTPDDGPMPIDALEREDALRLLQECLRELPERDARVLALYYYEELRLREIAQLLGVTESRVSQIRHAALKTLRALLTDRGVEP